MKDSKGFTRFVYIFVGIVVLTVIISSFTKKPTPAKPETKQNTSQSSSANAEQAVTITPQEQQIADKIIANYAQSQGWTVQELINHTPATLDVKREVASMVHNSMTYHWQNGKLEQTSMQYLQGATHPIVPNRMQEPNPPKP